MSSADSGQPVVHLGQDGVLLLERHVELLAEDLGVEEVLDPEADPGRLVGVGRADAALGRPQGVLAQEALGHPVELLVVRHDQVGVAAHHQAAGVDALGGQAVELVEQHGRVDHHAVADDRRDVVVEDAARDQLEGEGLAVDHDAVAGVVAALVAHDHVHLAGQEVGELALPLVAPLGPDHHGCGHASSPFARRLGLRTTLPLPETGAVPAGPSGARAGETARWAKGGSDGGGVARPGRCHRASREECRRETTLPPLGPARPAGRRHGGDGGAGLLAVPQRRHDSGRRRDAGHEREPARAPLRRHDRRTGPGGRRGTGGVGPRLGRSRRTPRPAP